MLNEIIGEKNEIESAKRDIVESVSQKVTSFMELGEIKIPSDYCHENALKSAWLILKELKGKDEYKNEKLAIEMCSKTSVANCLFDMVVQGLSPVKKQCYFVPLGGKLTLMRSYMGTVALAKRYGNVKDVVANVVYEGDDFEFEVEVETGKKRIIKHKQSLESLDRSILGGYAVVTLNDGSNHIEIMTMKQIKAAWEMGTAKGNSKAHQNFPAEMAKKTVITRACKLLINTSSDAGLLEDDEFETIDHAEASVKQEIADNSNKGAVLGVEEDNVIDMPLETSQQSESYKAEEAKEYTHQSHKNEQVSIDYSLAEPGF